MVLPVTDAPFIVFVETVFNVLVLHAALVKVPPSIFCAFWSTTISIGYGAANHPAVTKLVTVTEEAEIVVAVMFVAVTVAAVTVFGEMSVPPEMFERRASSSKKTFRKFSFVSQFFSSNGGCWLSPNKRDAKAKNARGIARFIGIPPFLFSLSP